MNTKQIKLIVSLLVLTSPACQAGSLFVSLDTYEYNTNLADLNLDYEPVGAIIGAKFDFNDQTFLQLQYGRWSEDNAEVFAPGFSGSDFDSTLANIGFGYTWGRWDIYVAYTDLNDEMTVSSGLNSEFQSFGETDSSTLQANFGTSFETGRWSRSVRFGLQYDDSTTIAALSPTQDIVRQENDALYASLMLGADYFLGNVDTKGWFFGVNLNWYQELSSNDSISSLNVNMPGVIADRNLTPIPGRGAPGANNGPVGNGARGVNRTNGKSFGVLGLYATYMISEDWSLDISPSFGFAGDVNTNSFSLALSRKF